MKAVQEEDTPRRRWTPQTVVDTITCYANDGRPLNAQAIIDTDGALWAAARRAFGSWSGALQAAGIDPVSVKAHGQRRSPGSWSPEKVVQSIEQYTRQGCRMNARNMQKIDNALVSAAVYYFGTWAQALEKAGIDAEYVRQHRFWSPKQVTEEISRAHQAGADLSGQSVRHWNGGLYGAAHVHFGSWRGAIESAGIDYSTISRNPRWSRSRIRRLVIQFLANGLSVQECFGYNRHLQSRVKRQWGDIPAFLKDLGVQTIEQGDVRIPRLGQALRTWRKESGYSLVELARRVGLPKEVLDMYETSQATIPFVTALRLSQAFNRTMDDLVGVATQPIRPESESSLSFAAPMV